MIQTMWICSSEQNDMNPYHPQYNVKNTELEKRGPGLYSELQQPLALNHGPITSQ